MYRVSFAISSVFVAYSSLILLSWDWTRPRADPGPHEGAAAEAEAEVTQEAAGGASKKRPGTYKIITSYLEAGEGEEGLDWELVMTEDGDTAILQFPYYVCVSNRLSTLPADFLRDLGAVLQLAAGLGGLVLRSLWEQPRQPRIEVTVATPDYDYLPDNHPLRKIHLHQSGAEAEQPEEAGSKVSGFVENVRKVVIAVAQFHYQFYDDLFSTLKIGFGFLFYLISGFPMDVFLHFVDTSGGQQQRSVGESLRTVVTVVPSLLQGLVGAVTSAVEAANLMVRNLVQNREAAAPGQASPGGKKSATPPASGSSSTFIKQDFPRKQSLPSASSKIESKKPDSKPEKKQSPPQKKKSESKPPTGVQPSKPEAIPAKSIEAFKNEVKIQEEILKFGKDKARELFTGPVVVSGPWIAEEKEAIGAGYTDQRQYEAAANTFPSRSLDSSKSGVFDHRREEFKPPVESNFDAPLPTSSVFERETSGGGFEMKAKVRSSANLHSSLYNIHAACELEHETDTDNLEELEKLRDVSPSPEPSTADQEFRTSDLAGTEARPRPLGLYHASHFTSMLSEAPRESPDLKGKYSVKDEIAQLRYFNIILTLIFSDNIVEGKQ